MPRHGAPCLWRDPWSAAPAQRAAHQGDVAMGRPMAAARPGPAEPAPRPAGVVFAMTIGEAPAKLAFAAGAIRPDPDAVAMRAPIHEPALAANGARPGHHHSWPGDRVPDPAPVPGIHRPAWPPRHSEAVRRWRGRALLPPGQPALPSIVIPCGSIAPALELLRHIRQICGMPLASCNPARVGSGQFIALGFPQHREKRHGG